MVVVDDTTIGLVTGIAALVIAYIRNHYSGKYNESKHIIHTARMLVDLVDDDLWDDKIDDAQFRAKFTKARDIIRNYDTPNETPDISSSSTPKPIATTTTSQPESSGTAK